MITLSPTGIQEIAVIGAHCDDIAMGAGGTLLTLAKENPEIRVKALVFSGRNSQREAEEWSALNAFCPAAKVELTVLDFPDGLLPEHWSAVKKALASLYQHGNPDLVFAPNKHDAHQDHRLLAELVPTVFRDSLALGYEIVKWESDLGAPVVYQPLAPEIAEQKVDLLAEHYSSQKGKYWFKRETFLSLARIRGVHCRAPYAEAFFTDKLTIDLSGV